jgi:hypothetical protein
MAQHVPDVSDLKLANSKQLLVTADLMMASGTSHPSRRGDPTPQ